jgi:uncharacterized protein YqeY
MSATALKKRLRADLKAALQARASNEIRVLRTLIAALDNAEAVPTDALQISALPRAFGDGSGEIARRELGGHAVAALLAEEVASRLAAAADYERHGREDVAERLRAEAALVARYARP